MMTIIFSSKFIRQWADRKKVQRCFMHTIYIYICRERETQTLLFLANCESHKTLMEIFSSVFKKSIKSIFDAKSKLFASLTFVFLFIYLSFFGKAQSKQKALLLSDNLKPEKKKSSKPLQVEERKIQSSETTRGKTSTE